MRVVNCWTHDGLWMVVEDPKKWQIKVKTYMAPFWKENQLVLDPKNELKGELVIWRTKMQARVQLNDSLGFQMTPNWFLGIWTLQPHLK